MDGNFFTYRDGLKTKQRKICAEYSWEFGEGLSHRYLDNNSRSLRFTVHDVAIIGSVCIWLVSFLLCLFFFNLFHSALDRSFNNVR